MHARLPVLQGRVLRRVPRTRSIELVCSVPYIRGMFSVGVGLVVWLTLARRWVSGRALLLSRVLTQDLNLARLGFLADRDDQAEHAVVVRGGDVCRVHTLTEAELAEVGTRRSLLNEPLDSLDAGCSALGADGQQLTVDVDVYRLRFDPGQVGGENVTVSLTVQVYRHHTRSRTGLKQAGREAVELAQRIERQCDDESFPFRMRLLGSIPIPLN